MDVYVRYVDHGAWLVSNFPEGGLLVESMAQGLDLADHWMRFRPGGKLVIVGPDQEVVITGEEGDIEGLHLPNVS